MSDSTLITEEFLTDVLAGLSSDPKCLPCKYFYDERGSALFDAICKLPEYYLTRTEQQIMDDHIGEMAKQLGAGVMLVEFGSGSSTKTRTLLDHLIEPAAYVPLDISEQHLLATAQDLRIAYPDIEILPVVADFTKNFDLPNSKIAPSHAAVYFPGSTIGNFTPVEAHTILSRIAGILGQEGGLLIGIDLQKEISILEAAYNDSQGITAKFNLNILRRMNSELGANFDLAGFEHVVVYNSNAGRIEIFVESKRNQSVRIGDQQINFSAGERVHTEHSHKYTVEGFRALAADAGFAFRKAWTDENRMFAVLHLVNTNS